MTPKMAARMYTIVSSVIDLLLFFDTGIKIDIENKDTCKKKPKRVSKQNRILYCIHKRSFWHNIANRKDRKLAPKLKNVSNNPPAIAVCGATMGAIMPPANHATANWVKNSA